MKKSDEYLEKLKSAFVQGNDNDANILCNVVHYLTTLDDEKPKLMDIHQAIAATREGKKVRRKGWHNESFVFFDFDDEEVDVNDIEAKDWYIVE